MRVVIASRIYRPEPAAASFFLGGVADALRAAGAEVEVLTAKPLPGQGDGSRGERIRTFPVLRDRNGYVKGYLQYLSFDLPLVVRLLTVRRADVVFVEPPPTTGAVVRIVCALRRIPYVYDAADIWSDAAGQATGSGLVVRVLRALERFAMRGAARMVTISQGVVDRVRELGVGTPVEVTGFGADTTVFRYQAAPVEPVFVYAGTYSELHGADVLVDAFAAFARTHEGYRLRFIGNGTDEAGMRARARALGVADRVEFAGPVAASELRPQLARAVASLATLRPGGGYEYAFTSKAYSSLATGCPVIFAGPGPTGPFIDRAAREVVAGRAVDYDAEAIAAAMRAAADAPATAAERERLADWAGVHHSMRAVTERVASTVIDVGAERRAS
ncbi:glycosyltransferase [Leucobacter allii]|uniref:D-inositol 3-phosphate glycosyltransferase n=1 Tax=Leucobacter allii TaxID=2932247 RepID=A0ABY4FN87_9MICO|nr:glycosyltransferase [Leucobacter allii]UOQ57711.1 glycosyltransferase [Leucobacter allii]